MRTKYLLPALLAALAPAAAQSAPAEHSLTVRIFKGQAEYTQVLQAQEDRQLSFVGPAGDKEMIFNGLLARAEDPAHFSLQYQLELSDGRGAGGRSIQGQGEVALWAGSNMTVLESGPWAVRIALDAKKNAKRTPWNEKGLPNYRLTADVYAGTYKQSCRLTTKAGIQSNVTDGMRGAHKTGFIFTAYLKPGDTAGSFDLQYQIEQSLHSPDQPFQLQNLATLVPGKNRHVAGKGYRIDLLLEGGAPAQPARGAAAKPRGKNSYAVVPLIE